MSTATEINPVFLGHLRHMLGAGPEKKKSIHGYRNGFCAGVASDNFQHMLEMEKLGLVTSGKKLNGDSSQYFHATVSGCKAIGLSNAGIKRAFEQ